MEHEYCIICKKKLENDGHFWKEHRIKASDYYTTYFPKADLFTKQQIPFKNSEQYFNTKFLNRTNLKKYIDSLPTLKDQQDFCKSLLLERKEKKQLIWSPTQVELRSLILPTLHTYNKLFPDGYLKLCEELGFKNKFTNDEKTKIIIDKKHLDKKIHICIDTREQTPLKFLIDFQVVKLDFGDYALSNDKVSNYVYVERKNINDFISTLSSGYDRFKNEIIRAKERNCYLVIMITSPIEYALNFNYSKWLNKFTKASSDFIFHRVRELNQEFDNIQFVFIENVEKARNLTQLLLLSNGICKNIDLQYYLECNLLDV